MNVLLTGSSSGIGNAVALYLLEKDINVIGLDINESSINHERFSFYKCDVSNVTNLKEVYEKIKDIKLDALINIAGMFLIDSFIEIDDASLKKIFDVNMFGTMNVNKIFFPLLKEKGRIVITTSEVAPLDPMPFNGIYNVTKTALDSYSQALRQELNLLGYKVITIRPGAFATKLAKGSLDKTKELMDKTILYKDNSKKFYVLVKSFMGKPSDPNKIAKTYFKAISKKRPKLIYKKHINQLLKLLNILPKRLQCFIVKSLIK